MTWTERILKAIEPEDNPRNTIYGSLAAGLLIAAEDPATETYSRVITATVLAVAIYWPGPRLRPLGRATVPWRGPPPALGARPHQRAYP